MNLKLKWDERKMKKALQDIDRYAKEKQKDISNQIAASTLTIETSAKKKAPVGTPESTGIKGYRGGRLRASINSEIKPNTGSVLTNVEYAQFVEFGTYKMAAQPFLFPAWNEERPKFLRKMKDILRKLK